MKNTSHSKLCVQNKIILIIQIILIFRRAGDIWESFMPKSNQIIDYVSKNDVTHFS